MISRLQRMKENLVTAVCNRFQSRSAHIFIMRVEYYHGGTRTKFWQRQCPCRSMVEFSSDPFRMFMMTISNKNGSFPVTNYGVRP